MQLAIGYARISDEDQSRTSLEDQPIQIEEYCKQNNLTLVHTFIENGKSAFTFNRPEWLKLEAFIKQNKAVKYLIVKHIDRFSRADLVDALIKVREIEERLQVKIQSINQPFDQDRNDLGFKLLRTMELLMSNNERSRIQERTKDGTYRTLTQGRWPSLAPYGYKNARDAAGKPILFIDEDKAAKVKQVFTLFSKGVKAFDIARQLKMSHNRSFITEMLKKSIYAGIIQVPAYKGKPAYETTSINEPIITKTLFYQVQALLTRKGNQYHGNEDVWMRGVLRCSECGRLLTAGRSKGYNQFYWYYKCGIHRVNLPTNKLHEQYLQILDTCSLPQKSIEVIKQSVIAKIDDMKKNKGGDFMRLKMELTKLKSKISGVQERFLSAGDIDVNVFQKTISELKERETALEQQIADLHGEDFNLYDKVDAVISQLADLRKTFLNLPVDMKQKFIIVQLGVNLSHSGQLFLADYLHPMFAHNEHKMKELGLLEIKNPPEIIGKVGKSIQDLTIGQLFDFIFLAV